VTLRGVRRTLLFSGFDFHAPALPDGARVILPPITLPALDRFRDLALRALDEALDRALQGTPLTPSSRVTVLVDDPSLPVPPPAQDCRGEMLDAALKVLSARGVRPTRVNVLVANGLNRQWRESELKELVGAPTFGAVRIVCHDAESHAGVTRLGEEPEGPVELSKLLVETDLVLHLNLVSLPILAGTAGLVTGATGYRTARYLNSPALLAGEGSPFQPGSAYHLAHERVASHLSRQTPIVQLSVIQNNDVWPPALAALLRPSEGLAQPFQMWNSLPAAVRQRAGRMLRSRYRPFAVLAGTPEEVGPKALELFKRQHEVRVDKDADVVVFGLPDQGPYSAGASQNPVLAANLALGFLLNLHAGKSLLRPGGVVLFANPLTPTFDRKVHAAYEELYERVLRVERDAGAIHERYEPYFAGRPEYVAAYQKRFAFHGTHPLFAWSLCSAVRARAGRIIVAHGDPRSCARLGFTPANDLQDGLNKAKEFLGGAQPNVAVLELPPAFWARVGG
jgi:lactate racemase